MLCTLISEELFAYFKGERECCVKYISFNLFFQNTFLNLLWLLCNLFWSLWRFLVTDLGHSMTFTWADRRISLEDEKGDGGAQGIAQTEQHSMEQKREARIPLIQEPTWFRQPAPTGRDFHPQVTLKMQAAALRLWLAGVWSMETGVFSCLPSKGAL